MFLSVCSFALLHTDITSPLQQHQQLLVSLLDSHQHSRALLKSLPASQLECLRVHIQQFYDHHRYLSDDYLYDSDCDSDNDNNDNHDNDIHKVDSDDTDDSEDN